eukprot:TRINITY_DN3453_c0_g3_i2.p1 TRINITY_DN3453_c0_g3~~TRINITY_DN3453_c0_g3_i2.p1  ORF type:complete len:702 (-),score=63.94 TRINITY_DN3453_c0_g3_i2:1317-3236(-)
MWPEFYGVNEEYAGGEGRYKQAIFYPIKRKDLGGNYEGMYDLATRTVRWIRRLKSADLLDPQNSYAYAAQVPQNIEAGKSLMTCTEFRRMRDAVCNYQQIMRVNYIPIKPEVIEVTLRFKDYKVLHKSLGIYTTDDLVLPYPIITNVEDLGISGTQSLLTGRYIIQVGDQDTSLIRITQYTLSELFAKECLGADFFEILNGEKECEKDQLQLTLLISKTQVNLTFPDPSDELDTTLRCCDFYPKVIPKNRNENQFDSPLNVFHRAMAWIQQQVNLGVRALIPELMPVQTIFGIVEMLPGNVLDDVFLQDGQRIAIRRLAVKEVVGVAEVARSYTVVQAVRVWYRSTPTKMKLTEVTLNIQHPKDMPVRVQDLGLKLSRHYALPHPHVQFKFPTAGGLVTVKEIDKIPLGSMLVAINGDISILHPSRFTNSRTYAQELNDTVLVKAGEAVEQLNNARESFPQTKLKSFFTAKNSRNKNNSSAQKLDNFSSEMITTPIKVAVSKAKIDALEVPDSNLVSWADCSGDMMNCSNLGDHEPEPLPLGEIAYRAITYTQLKQNKIDQSKKVTNFELRPMWQIVCFPENREGVKETFRPRLIQLPDDHEQEELQFKSPVPMITSIYKTSFNRTKFKQAVRVIYPLI